MIQISNLSKKYGETVVFSDLNYTFENACIYGLVGRNGAGKTTLLNILSNYEKNYTGVISIDRKKMNKVWMPIQSIIIFTAKNRLQRLLYILPFYILSLLSMRVWQMFFNNKIIDFLSKTAYNLSRNILLLSTVTGRVLSMPITK